MYNEKFSEFIAALLKKALEEVSLEKSVTVLAEDLSQRYKGTQIYFGEKFTTRIAYITGAGKESFEESEKIELNSRYFLFFQNFEQVPLYEKEIIISMCKIITLIKEK